jgi:hypothetical protein
MSGRMDHVVLFTGRKENRKCEGIVLCFSSYYEVDQLGQPISTFHAKNYLSD